MVTQITVATEIIQKHCILPPLNSDIGSEHIDASTFEDFRIQLNINLNTLFDTIHENRLLECLDTESEGNSLSVYLCLLFCEQTSYDIFYQTNEKILLQNIHKLEEPISAYLKKPHIYKELLFWYKSRIRTNIWKREMGAAHGLARFCEVKLMILKLKWHKIFYKHFSAFIQSLTYILIQMIVCFYCQLEL